MSSSTTSSSLKFPSLFRRGSKDSFLGDTKGDTASSIKSGTSSHEKPKSISSVRSFKERVRNFSLRRLPSFSKSKTTIQPPAPPAPTTEPSSSHVPYAVFHQHQNMRSIFLLLRSPETMSWLLQMILEGMGGRRTLVRLARTCKALEGPVMDVLWKDLPSLVPILSLFPSQLLKRPKKPGMGLTKNPEDQDWKVILKYNQRVQTLKYDERLGNVSPTIFPILEAYNAKENGYLFPNLRSLTLDVSSPAGMERCRLFLSPHLENLFLDLGPQCSQLGSVLLDMATKTKLKTFELRSPNTLPANFAELLRPQDELERISILAPGSITAAMGGWLSTLAQLKSLELDLSKNGGPKVDITGFHGKENGHARSSTPMSAGSRDSGVFSGDDMDFIEDHKKRRVSVGNGRVAAVKRAPFRALEQLVLSGNAVPVSMFLDGFSCDLMHLDLSIEDPPLEDNWRRLANQICLSFAESLKSLRIKPIQNSKLVEMVKTSTRGTNSPPLRHLSLLPLHDLHSLTRLELDLSESVYFTTQDMEHLALACPNVEELRLLPFAKYPVTSGPPRLTLEALIPLIQGCQRLHSLTAVVNAKSGDLEVLMSSESSTFVLKNLHLGHSWIREHLQVAIILAHMAPQLENLKWYHERNRPGYIEANARGWQSVADALPLLQDCVERERRNTASFFESQVEFEEVVSLPPPLEYVEAAIQCQPSTHEVMVDAVPLTKDVSIDSVPSVTSVSVEAFVELSDVEVDATPSTVSTFVQVEVSDMEDKEILGLDVFDVEEKMVETESGLLRSFVPRPLAVPLTGLFDFAGAACRVFILYPLSVPTRITRRVLGVPSFLYNQFATIQQLNRRPEAWTKAESAGQEEQEKSDHSTIHVLNKAERKIEWGMHRGKRQVQPHPDHNTLFENARLLRVTSKPSVPSSITTSSTRMSAEKKQEKDFTSEVDAILPEAENLVKAGQLQAGLDKLFALEKQTRNAADVKSTTRLVTAIAQHTWDAKDLALLNSSISLLSKKHGQLKATVQALVELAMTWLDEIKETYGVEKWLELVETLRTVTEGKIYLETPRARVTSALSKYHEGLASSSKDPDAAKASIETASELLSDLQVETYSSMDRREKTEFILEQMRLLIAVAQRKDSDYEKSGSKTGSNGEAEWIRVRVGGRKVNEGFLTDEKNEDIKLKYYDLMIQHALHESAYLDATKYYYKIWETPSVKEDKKGKGMVTLEHIVCYIILAPHTNEQSDMLHHLHIDAELSKHPQHYELIKSFVKRELMRWPGVVELYGEFLKSTPVFKVKKHWDDLHSRVTEHNVRVISQYYSRITLPRITTLLDFSPEETEKTLSRLVVSGSIWARIDRLSGIVNFKPKRTADDIMNDWSSDMQKLLGLAEKTWMGMNAAQAAHSRALATAS